VRPALSLVLVLGCSLDRTAVVGRPGNDGGARDAGISSSVDAGPPADTGPARDSGSVGRRDAGRRDAGPRPIDAGPDAGPLPAEVGDACSTAADCGGVGWECLHELDFGFGDPLTLPGGYCTRPCSVDLECGASAECLERLDRCGRTCGSSLDCRPEYRCDDVFGRGPYCLPPLPF